MSELRWLEQAGYGSGVDVIVLTDKPRIETILEYVVRGNEAQIGDPASVSELKKLIRFNETDAVGARDGLFSRSTGTQASRGAKSHRFARSLPDGSASARGGLTSSCDSAAGPEMPRSLRQPVEEVLV